MISKNFDFLKDTKLSDYYEKVDILEEKINNTDYPFILETGKILENFLSYFTGQKYDDNGYQNMLRKLINIAINRWEYYISFRKLEQKSCSTLK